MLEFLPRDTLGLRAARELVSESGVPGPSDSTFHRWASHGIQLANGERARLKLYKIGNRWRVSQSELAAFLVLTSEVVEPAVGA
jgi:hypothetical protein